MAMVMEVEGDVVVSIPMFFRCVAGKKQLVLNDEPQPLNVNQIADNAIVAAFARAHAWMKMLDSGVVANVKELAEKVEVDRPYVVRTLRLATLSPRILQGVLHGHSPDGLSVEKLAAIQSDDWAEQEREAGFVKEK